MGRMLVVVFDNEQRSIIALNQRPGAQISLLFCAIHLP